MSATEATPEIKAERKARPDPKPLTTEYHKAHKQVLLWAAILLVWELVGVDLEKAKEAGGNVGALVKSIKSPQAVPWVLLILIGYFLFKITVEWYQCNHLRRASPLARADFYSAWCISLLTYALYIGQASSQIQFADLLRQSRNLGVILGVVLMTGLGLYIGVLLRFAWEDGHLSWHSLKTVGISIFAFLFAISLGVSWTTAIRTVALGLGLSFLFQLSIFIWGKRLERQLYDQPHVQR